MHAFFIALLLRCISLRVDSVAIMLTSCRSGTMP